MKKVLLKIVKNPVLQIGAVYFMAHFFIFILSGCWWDDWTFMTHDLNYINIVASESGRPEWNFLVPLCWSLPNNGRILIFFLYLFMSLFVYEFLKDSTLFDKKESLIIASLFAVFPVNEARILISNFAYAVGLFFFYLSLMLFSKWNGLEAGKKKNVLRVLLLISFFVSFILNSVLAYYYILFVYLFAVDFLANKEKKFLLRTLLSVKNVVFRYPDFFVLPFIYYGTNKILFPTYGDTFGNYNSISFGGLLKSVLYIPLSVVEVFANISKRAVANLNLFTAMILCISVLITYFWKNDREEKRDPLRCMLMFAGGLVVLTLGLFPYVMVRGRVIDLIGVKGRDGILVPFGTSIMICSLLRLLNGRFRRVSVTALVIVGIICFNSLYIEWQKDYYYQLSIQNLLNNDVVRDNNTFFITDINETDVQGERYYSFNALSYFVFGDETRFFMPKVSDLYIFKDEKNMKHAIEALGYSHMMRDYEPDYCFDAVLDYRNDLSTKDVLELKGYEMFDPERFDKLIRNSGSLRVVIVDESFTKKLMEGYDNGSIRHDEDVLELLMSY